LPALDLAGELVAVGEGVGVTLEPQVSALGGRFGPLSALMEDLEAAAVLAAGPGEDTRSRLALELMAAFGEAAQVAAPIPGCLPGDPSVEVGQPRSEYGQRLRRRQRVPQNSDGGLIGGHPTEGTGQDLGGPPPDLPRSPFIEQGACARALASKSTID
jgi:hypothetical protein